MKNLRTPALLLGVLLILGGVAYWDDWKTQREEGEKKDANKLFTFEDAAVTAIDFFHKGEDEDVSIRLEKKDGDWVITAPVQAKASQDEVINLLKSVREYQYERVAAETKDRWKDFGLEDPQARITLHTPAGEETLILGIKAPVGYSLYASTGKDEKAYLGSQYIDLATNKKLYDFRDKTLVAIKTDGLKNIRFSKPGEKPIAISHEDGQWTMTSPQGIDVDPDEVVQFISSLNAERVEAFFDGPPAKMREAFSGKAKDAKVLATLSWEAQSGENHTLTFVQSGTNVLASENPNALIMQVSEGITQKLDKNANNFRRRKVFAFDPLKAKAVTVDGIAYQKQGDHWTRKGQEEPAPHVASLLDDLSQAKTDRFEDLAGKLAQGLGTPKHSLSLELDDPNLSQVEISLWADKGDPGKYFLKHTGGAYLYRVGDRVIQHLSPESSATVPVLDENHDDHDHG